MRIGIAQINTVPGEFDRTVGHMVAQSQRAAEQGVELLIFPLAALAGIDVLPFADRGSYLRDVSDALARLSDELACPALVPAPIDTGGEMSVFDVVLIEGGAVRPLRATRNVAGASEREVTQFEFGGLRLALALSHDDLDTLDDYDYEVDAVIFLSGYSFALDDPSSAMGADLDFSRFVPDAQTMGAWLVGAASVGGYGDQVFSGSSMVLAPSGELAALAPAFEESLLVADVDVPAPERLGDAVVPEVYDAPFHLWQAICLGIHDYLSKQGMTDVALCLDGSLDSMVLAALASDAVGPLHVHALVGGSSGNRAPACRELGRRLRIDVTSSVGQVRGFDQRDLDELELAALAREHDAFAISSLDKTALALGAHAGNVRAAALCPLGDVYRSDVLDMAHVRNTISPLFRRVDLTAADAIELPMSAGSSRLLTTEADFTSVDEVLLGYVEYDRPLGELVATESYDPELVDAVLRAERRTEPLRRAMPPVLAMSTHTLDDARFPLGVSWHDEHLDFVGESPAEAHGSEPEHPEDEAPVERRPAHDIDATLAMLRDLAEQGGFVPSDLMEQAASFKPGEQGEGADPLGWMSPFSEN